MVLFHCPPSDCTQPSDVAIAVRSANQDLISRTFIAPTLGEARRFSRCNPSQTLDDSRFAAVVRPYQDSQAAAMLAVWYRERQLMYVRESAKPVYFEFL